MIEVLEQYDFAVVGEAPSGSELDYYSDLKESFDEHLELLHTGLSGEVSDSIVQVFDYIVDSPLCIALFCSFLVVMSARACRCIINLFRR